MRNKSKGIKIKLIPLLTLTILIMTINKADASKEATMAKLMAGLNEINTQSKALRATQAYKYEKLEADLDEFYDKGSSKISKDNFFHVRHVGDFSAEELDSGLAGTGLAGLGADFKAAEESYGVNAMLLMAMAKHETGNGTSELFKNKNNLFGFNAVDHDPYNQATDFDTPADSINAVAKHLSENYLNPDGQYFNGMSTDGIGVYYATDPDWSKKVNWMMIEVARAMIDNYNTEANN